MLRGRLDGGDRIKFGACLGLLAGLLPTVAFAAEASATRTISDMRHDVSAFLAELETLRIDAGIPGLSVAVLEDQQLLLAAGLGFADLAGGVPATADTPYDIASVTKPLSAVLAMRLVEHGELDLDRPIAEYSDWADFCAGFSRQPTIFARELRCEPATHTLRHMLSHTVGGTPGTRFSYNPIVYSWASRPIMAATGTPFSTLFAREILDPTGMEDSARRHRDLPLPDTLAARLAIPHRLNEAGAIERSPPRSAQGDGAAGGIISTVLDLARFDAAFDHGELLSTASRAEMTTPTRANDGSPRPYGLGFYVQDFEGQRLLWHSGWWEEAYSALYLKVPERNLTLILLANSEGIWWGNPLDEARVEDSPFARAFLRTFADQ